MERTDLQRLSKDELIDLVLQLQRPDKTSRTSSKPPSTDKKEKREHARPGGVVTLPNRGVTNPRRLIHQAAAAASRHVCVADALKARCVLAEVRWRWT
jgi:hypothetical protein